MKKIILMLAAAGTLASVPANAADFGRDNHYRPNQVQQNWKSNGHDNRFKGRPAQVNQGHRWARGQRFDRRYANNYQVINNYQAYRLQAPPRGYRYVRSNNDIVMVAIASGIIGAVFGNAF